MLDLAKGSTLTNVIFHRRLVAEAGQNLWSRYGVVEIDQCSAESKAMCG
jgi:hypothetical protein